MVLVLINCTNKLYSTSDPWSKFVSTYYRYVVSDARLLPPPLLSFPFCCSHSLVRVDMTANKNESLSQAVVVAENGTSAINYRGLRDFDCGRHLDK